VVHWESRTLIRFFNFGFKRHSILFGFIGWCRDELLWLTQVEVVRTKKPQRGRKFSIQEDICLVSS
jgi:hypothetical protein